VSPRGKDHCQLTYDGGNARCRLEPIWPVDDVRSVVPERAVPERGVPEQQRSNGRAQAVVPAQSAWSAVSQIERTVFLSNSAPRTECATTRRRVNRAESHAGWADLLGLPFRGDRVCGRSKLRPGRRTARPNRGQSEREAATLLAGATWPPPRCGSALPMWVRSTRGNSTPPLGQDSSSARTRRRTPEGVPTVDGGLATRPAQSTQALAAEQVVSALVAPDKAAEKSSIRRLRSPKQRLAACRSSPARTGFVQVRRPSCLPGEVAAKATSRQASAMDGVPGRSGPHDFQTGARA